MQKQLHNILFLVLLLCSTQHLFAQNCNNPPILNIEWIQDDFCGMCNGSASVTALNGTPPYTYFWSNFVGNSPQVFNLCPGTYTVTVTDANGCTATQAVSLNFAPPLTVFIQQIPDPTACGCVTLQAISTGGVAGCATYMWSNGATGITNLVCQNGDYTVTVSDCEMGCSAFASTVVNVNCYDVEPATCSLCNGSITMPPDTINSLYPYFIQSPNGGSIQAFAGDVVENLCAGNYFIYQQGSGSQQTVLIENLQLPFITDANFTTSAGNGDVINLCAGQTVQFFAPETNLLVSWDFGNGQTSNSLSPTTSYPNTGTFDITLTAQGCDSTATRTITAIVEQGIAPTITCASLVCPGIAETYTTDVVCDTYNWSVVGGTITAGAGTNTISVVWNDVQIGNVSLSVGGACDGSALCNPVATINIPIISNNISILGDEVVCSNSTTVYSVPQYGGVQYNFSVTPNSAGTVVWQQNNQAGIHWNNNGIDGTVQVAMSSSLLDCVANNSLPVQVNVPYSISGITELCGNATATYTASAGLHNWSVTGNAIIVSGASNSNSAVVQGISGNFTVSATPTTPSNYCNYPQSISVTVTDAPLAPQIVGEQIICPSNSYTYDIAAPVLGYNYHWTVVGGTPTTANGEQLTITWDGSGVYQLSATAQSSISPFCESVAGTLAISKLQSITLSGDDSVCSGDVATYNATPNLPDLDYTWTINPPEAGTIASGNGTATANVQWYLGYPTATLTASVCGVQSQLAVTIHTAAEPTIVQSNDLCAGSSINLSVTQPYSAYTWTGGGTSNTISANSGGDYVVTVTDAFGCTNNAVYNLHEYPLPEAAISLSDYGYMCTNDLHNVTVAALVNPDYNYAWSVNGAAIGTNASSYTHVATPVANSFSYQATVTDNHGCVAVSNTATITQVVCGGGGGCGGSCPNPGAGGGCVPNVTDFIGIQAITPHCSTVTFNNVSVGAISYQWDFGDGSPIVTVGNTSAQTHTYTEPGYFTVMIYGTYPNTLASPAFCIYAAYTVVEIPLKADFDFVSPCINTATEFTDLSRTSQNATILTWTWDFGDGTPTSSAQNPTHLYSNAGTYNVTLVIGNGACTASTTKTVIVDPLPDATFVVPSLICEGSELSFTPNNATNQISWLWDFGDATTVSAQNAQHTYLQDGNYTLSLVVKDNHGCTANSSQSINTLPVTIENITAPDLSLCEGETALLTAPTGTSFQWSTGNTTTNPLAVTTAGTYNVNVVQANGCSYTSPDVVVNFSPLPAAQIQGSSPVMLCPNTSTTLNANIGDDYAYSWSTSSNASSITLNYNNINPTNTITVTVTDPNSGCSSVSPAVVVEKVVVDAPSVVAADPQLCEGESTTVTATHLTLNNFTWSTGATGNNISVNTGGVYWAVVTDANGCSNSGSTLVQVNANMDMDLIPVGCYDYCEDGFIEVPDMFENYQWLLDGVPMAGATTNQLSPTVSGDYQLIVGNSWGCHDTSEYLTLELIDCYPCLVTPSFTYLISCGNVQCTPTSTGNGSLSHQWDFGDGTGLSNSPSHNYTQAGTYNVCLTTTNIAIDGDTCTANVCQNVSITIDDLFGVSSVVTNANCSQNDGAIDISVVGGVSPFSFAWSNVQFTEDISNLTAGTYTVTITGANACTATASATVETAITPLVLSCGTSTPNSITINWVAIPSAIGYNVVVDGTTIFVDTNTYTIGVLQPNETVEVSVISLLPDACLGDTATISCTTSPPPCLSAEVVATCVESTENSITVSWNSIPEAINYSILVDGVTTETTETSYTLNNLQAGESVSFEVTAIAAAGCTNSSSTVTCSTLPPPCLSAEVVATCVESTENSITVSWNSIPEAVNYSILVDGVATETTETSYTLSNLQAGESVSFEVTAIAPIGCTNSTSSVTCSTLIPLCLPENVSATLTTDAELPIWQNTNITLTATASGLSGTLSYTWASLDGAINCTQTDCSELEVLALHSDTYSVTITDQFGCSAVASLTTDVRVPNKVLIPNAFSPNNDDVNAVFRIAGYNVAEYRLRIYDRWGKLMYDSEMTTDILKGWDGYNNGKDAELDVYAYFAEVHFTDGTQQMLKGNVTLVR
jgi:gliding motility-associated-like protein